jgi:putative transcriptional regulator
MNIGKIILTHRKKMNMTQEQLADKLGVSVPAVSKWETNVSMPDITLLAPIARIFNISTDELLSFHSELTENEINHILDDIRRRAEQDGLAEAMKYADKMLQQYPNSEKLRLETALKLSAVSSISTGDLEATQKCREKVTKMFEELMYSEDFYISNAAKTGVGSIYMNSGRLEEAESIFNQMKIPDEWNSKRILPLIYMMKQDYGKAFEASEQNLEEDWSNMMIDLRSIYNTVLRSADYDRALAIAETVCTISGCFGNWLNNGLDMLLEVYLLKNDIEKALTTFENYIDQLIKSYTLPEARLGSSIFFAEINARRKSEANDEAKAQAGVKVLNIMHQSILADPRYEPIRSSEVYKRSMSKLILMP